MEFSEKLTANRKRLQLTQAELAGKIGVTRQAVARWEAGETLPETAALKKLCAVFGVSADYLIRSECCSEEDLSRSRLEENLLRSKAREAEQKELRRSNKKRFIICAAVFAALCAVLFALNLMVPPAEGINWFRILALLGSVGALAMAGSAVMYSIDNDERRWVE